MGHRNDNLEIFIVKVTQFNGSVTTTSLYKTTCEDCMEAQEKVYSHLNKTAGIPAYMPHQGIPDDVKYFNLVHLGVNVKNITNIE